MSSASLSSTTSSTLPYQSTGQTGTLLNEQERFQRGEGFQQGVGVGGIASTGTTAFAEREGFREGQGQLYGSTGTTTGLHGTGIQEEKMLLSKEKLMVGKQDREVGGIDISKHIERRTEEVPITLNKETVSIERRPVAAGSLGAGSTSGTAAHLTDFGKEKVIGATLHAEQAVAGKTIVPTEQIKVTKDRVGETQTVSGAVREENLEVKRDAFDRQQLGATGGSIGSAPVSSGGNIIGPDGRVTAYEEQLAVGKQRIPTGQVEAHKRIDTHMESAPVHLEHDAVGVQRTSGPISAAAPSTLTHGTVRIGVHQEQPVIGTAVVPKEEVILRKGERQEQALVQGEVLKERIDLRTAGGVQADKGMLAQGAQPAPLPTQSYSKPILTQQQGIQQTTTTTTGATAGLGGVGGAVPHFST